MRKNTSSRRRFTLLIIILVTLMLSSVKLSSTSAEICLDCGCSTGGPWYCPITEVTVVVNGNNITCRSIGCRLIPGSTYVCDYRKVGTMTRDGCPPLETCDQ
jgi:hypothetical protein